MRRAPAHADVRSDAATLVRSLLAMDPHPYQPTLARRPLTAAPRIAVALIMVTAAGAAAFLLSGPPATDSGRSPALASRGQFRVQVSVVPATALIELDGVQVGTDTLVRELPRDRRVHFLRASAEGFSPQIVSFVDAPPPERIVLERASPEQAAMPSAPLTRVLGPESCAGDRDCLLRFGLGFPGRDLPAPRESPTRADILAAMRAITPTVRQCGEGQPGPAVVRMTLAANGTVTSASVSPPFAAGPAAECIARAVRGVVVPPFTRAAFTVSYPFVLN